MAWILDRAWHGSDLGLNMEILQGGGLVCLDTIKIRLSRGYRGRGMGSNFNVKGVT